MVQYLFAKGFREGSFYFVCGRIKDLVIVRGRNISPQDVEHDVEEALPSQLRPGCSVCFNTVKESCEGVDYVAELRSTNLSFAEMSGIAEKIAKTITLLYSVEPYSVILLTPRSIPKKCCCRRTIRRTLEAKIWD